MKKYFKEKFQSVNIYYRDNQELLTGVAFDIDYFPANLDITFQTFLFNVKPNKEYVIALYFVPSYEPEALHLLNNITLSIPPENMTKKKHGYGLAFGFFSTFLPIEKECEVEFILELRSLDNLEEILDVYTTYLVFEEKK